MKTYTKIASKKVRGVDVKLGHDHLISEKDCFCVSAGGEVEYFTSRAKARQHFNKVVKKIRAATEMYQ